MNFYGLAYWVFMTILWSYWIYIIFPFQIRKFFWFAFGRSTSDGIFNMISEGIEYSKILKSEDKEFKSSKIYVEKNRTTRLAEEYGFITVEYEFAQEEYQSVESSEPNESFKSNENSKKKPYVIKSACILTGLALNAVLNTTDKKNFGWTCMWARTKSVCRKSWLLATAVAVVFGLYRAIDQIFF